MWRGRQMCWRTGGERRLIDHGERRPGISQFGPSESRRRRMVRSIGVDGLSAVVMGHTVRIERTTGIDHNIPGQDTLSGMTRREAEWEN
jgi:hypothetical protein